MTRLASWKRLLPVLAVLLVVLSFLSYAFALDRYPAPYVDEPFYNYPAVRFLDGDGLNWRVSTEAPAGDSEWAYHGPFFVRLQVATVKLFGFSLTAARLPQYLGAHLAVLLLCGLLLRQRLHLSAFIVALAWVGDRSLQEVLYGRMEGLVLACVALAFVALFYTVRTSDPRWAALCGLGLGMAAGFHPIALAFVLPTSASLWFVPASARRRVVAGFLAGGLIPAFLVLLCWLPDLRVSVQQFLWHSGKAAAYGSVTDRLREMLTALRWCRWWVLALALITAGWLLPRAVRAFAGRRSLETAEPRECLELLASLYAVAGLLVLFTPAVFPYYLVHFTLWPVLALSVAAYRLPGRRPNYAAAAALALAAVCWLPSLAWNGLRWREMALNYSRMPPEAWSGRIAAVIPPNARVVGTPELLPVIRQAGRSYEPFPWIDWVLRRKAPVPPGAWITLSESDWNYLRESGSALAGRKVAYHGPAYAGVRHLDYRFVIVEPRGGSAHRFGAEPNLSARHLANGER
jgi:hypothetical protein